MTMETLDTLFDEIVDFLATAPSVEDILAFEPSEMLKQRSHYLLEQNRHEKLTDDERAELDKFIDMNHFVNMLKIRTRQKHRTLFATL